MAPGGGDEKAFSWLEVGPNLHFRTIVLSPAIPRTNKINEVALPLLITK